MNEQQPMDVRGYAEAIEKALDTVEYEYEFRKKYGGHGIAGAWRITAEDMVKHLYKARVLLVGLLDLVESVEETIGTKQGEGSDGN